MSHLAFYHSVALPLAAKSGFFHLLRRLQRRSALILMYHGVLDERRGQRATNVNQVNVSEFRWQLEFVREHYTVVTLSDIIQRIKRARPIDGLAALTFDDGYLSVYQNAAEILRSLELASTTFLVAGCMEHNEITWYDKVEAHLLAADSGEISLGGVSYPVDADRTALMQKVKQRLKTAESIKERDEIVAELEEKTGPLSSERRSQYELMRWQQVRELQSQGMSFGVHTYSHPHLTKAGVNLRREIDEAASVIADRLSIPYRDLLFCYPDGDYNKAVRDYVEHSGLCGAVAVDNALADPGSDPFAVPRVAVGREHSKAMFADATVGFSRSLKKTLHF